MKVLARFLVAAAALLALCSSSAAQSVVQSGNVTPGHAVVWFGNGIVGDAGTAQDSAVSSFGTVAYQGNSPTLCASSGLPTTAGGYNQICLGATQTSVTLSINNYGGATGGLSILYNGTPLSTTIAGSGTAGSLAVWTGTATLGNATSAEIVASINAGAIPGSLIQNASITGTQIAPATITGSLLATNTINLNNIVTIAADTVLCNATSSTGNITACSSPVVTTLLAIDSGNAGICVESAASGNFNELCLGVTSTGGTLNLTNNGSASGTLTLQVNGSALFTAPNMYSNGTPGTTTYTTPTNAAGSLPLYLLCYVTGGGGGGAAGGTVTTAPGAGGTSSITASGVDLSSNGGGAPAAQQTSGAGGATFTSTGASASFGIPGGAGGNGSDIDASAANYPGGMGGVSWWGGSGGNLIATGAGAGNAYGSGGSGGAVGTTNTVSGGGGGSSGTLFAIIVNPAASYTVVVGASGSAGTGTENGGAGQVGIVVIFAHWQ
jgi:hypothetical protein